jgi:hypothetical protein
MSTPSVSALPTLPVYARAPVTRWISPKIGLRAVWLSRAVAAVCGRFCVWVFVCVRL